MKKKILIVCLIILIILLIPHKFSLWDGGSTVYKSILYEVVKVHRLSDNGGYYEGMEIRILGFKIFDNTKLVNKWQSNDYYELISLNVDESTLTNKGAIFILKNNSDEDYCYGPEYILEKYVDNRWEEILLDEPLSWNTVLYNLNKQEEIEININWENSYGILDNGKYRLLKNNIRKKNSPESRSYSVYAEFIIENK